MEIVWLGHSALRLRSNEVTLVTDPFADSLGFKMARQTAEIVTVSNGHPHHSDAEAIAGDPRVLSGPGEYEIAGFYITGIGTRLNSEGAERLLNTVFTIRAEGLALWPSGRSQPDPVSRTGATTAWDRRSVRAGRRCVYDLYS